MTWKWTTRISTFPLSKTNCTSPGYLLPLLQLEGQGWQGVTHQCQGWWVGVQRCIPTLWDKNILKSACWLHQAVKVTVFIPKRYGQRAMDLEPLILPEAYNYERAKSQTKAMPDLPELQALEPLITINIWAVFRAHQYFKNRLLLMTLCITQICLHRKKLFIYFGCHHTQG